MVTVTLGVFSMQSGCAGKTSVAPVFWPPAPDLPRLQYLRSVKDSTDVLEQGKMSLLSVGQDSSTAIAIVKPYAIAAAKGKIYLTDTVAADVLIIDLPGKKMSHLAGNLNVGKLSKPVGIAVDEVGNIYVADASRMEVLQYGPQGEYLRSIGKAEKIKPSDVKVDAECIYILDGNGGRILVMDRKNAELIRSVGQNGPDYARLAGPIGLANDSKGTLFVTNFDGRVVSYDRDGHFLKGFGQLGQSLGEFGRPRGLAVDKDGLLYVVDAAFQNTRIFDDGFHILMDFGTPGTQGSLNVPAGIAVSTDNLDYYQKLAAPGFNVEKVVFVVSQFGDHKVSIYGLGKKQGLDYDAEYTKILQEIEKKEKELQEKKNEKALEEKKQPDNKSAINGQGAPAAPAATK